MYQVCVRNKKVLELLFFRNIKQQRTFPQIAPIHHRVPIHPILRVCCFKVNFDAESLFKCNNFYLKKCKLFVKL